FTTWHARGQAESPAARRRAPDFPLHALRQGGRCGEGRAPIWRVSRLFLRKERACSVSPHSAGGAIGRTARSALSSLIARATQPPLHASAPAASSGSTRRASARSRAR